MSGPVIYLPEASADVADANAAYEQQAAGLGQRFLNALQSQVAKIAASPELYAVQGDGVRAVGLRRFPYVVHYRFENGTVFILAVLHSSQDPQEWLRRI